MLADQQELIYINSVRIQGVVKKTYRARWIVGTSGGARGVVVIVVRNGHDDTCSNPGPG